MAPKQKYYVVWEGRQPGIYDNWDDCLDQVDGFPGAKYKSFRSQEEAVEAYRGDGKEELQLLATIALKNTEAAMAAPLPASGVAPRHVDYSAIPEINLQAIAVDGACAGNPGMMEYRCVRVADGSEVFHLGPLPDGTNNVAEYLALVHALALLFRNNDSTTPIYTDSRTAVAWVRNRRSHTSLQRTPLNGRIFELIARADVWLQTHRVLNPILRWNTPLWGEIPADFDRK